MLQLYILLFSQLKLIQLFLKLFSECSQSVFDITRATSRQGYPSHSLSGAPQPALCPSFPYHRHRWPNRMLQHTAASPSLLCKPFSSVNVYALCLSLSCVGYFSLTYTLLHYFALTLQDLVCYFFICSNIHHTSPFLSNFCISHQRVDNTLPEDFIRLGQTEFNTNY